MGMIPAVTLIVPPEAMRGDSRVDSTLRLSPPCPNTLTHLKSQIRAFCGVDVIQRPDVEGLGVSPHDDEGLGKRSDPMLQASGERSEPDIFASAKLFLAIGGSFWGPHLKTGGAWSMGMTKT